MELTLEQLKRISDSVGERRGWDFSRMRVKRAPVPWNYTDVARQFLADTDSVLDVGTGGGELFLTLAPYFGKGVGIDSSVEMIEQALRNKMAQKAANVEFKAMDGNRLEFDDEHFDVVLNRHCDINVSQTARVLRTDGYFVTQQVAYENTINILNAFAWTPASFGDNWWQPVEQLAAEFEQSGCRVVAKAEYNVRYWFSDVESLVFWLKAVPLPEPFDLEHHWEGVNRIIREFSTPRGIETNEHRELLIVQKVMMSVE